MNPFAPQIPRYVPMPQYKVQLGNGGLGPILGWRVMDGDTGKMGPLLKRHEAEAVARVRNKRGG